MMRIGGGCGEHGADLHRRGVGAQHRRAAAGRRAEIERIHHRPRRMVRGDVQGGEIVPVIFDVRAFLDGEAHGAEDRRDLFHGAADRMDRARQVGARRLGDVDSFRCQPGVQRGLVQHCLARVQRIADLRLDAVDFGAGFFAQLRRHAAQRFQRGGDAAILAQQSDAQRLQLLRIRLADPVQIFQQRNLQVFGQHGITYISSPQPRWARAAWRWNSYKIRPLRNDPQSRMPAVRERRRNTSGEGRHFQ